MAILAQSTIYTRVFYAYLTSDHVSPATGLTVVVNLSKAGAAYGAAAGTVTEIANGAYKIALTTTDTGTLGDLAYYCTAATMDPVKFVDQVGPAPANTIQISGTAQTGRDLGADTAAISAKTTNLPASPADESLVIAATDAIYSRLGAPAGASVSADVAAVKSDTGTTLTDAAAIKAQTDQLTFHGTYVEVDVKELNDTALNGNGTTIPWGP